MVTWKYCRHDNKQLVMWVHTLDGSKVNVEKMEHSVKTSCLSLTAKSYWLEYLEYLTKPGSREIQNSKNVLECWNNDCGQSVLQPVSYIISINQSKKAWRAWCDGGRPKKREHLQINSMTHDSGEMTTTGRYGTDTGGIRASVDALCRDGTDEISRDPRIKRY